VRDRAGEALAPPRAPRREPVPARPADDTPLESIDISFTDVPSPVVTSANPVPLPAPPPEEVAEPTPTIIATTLGEIEGLLVERPQPAAPPPPAKRSARHSREAQIELADKSKVDDLLASFSVSSLDDGAMASARRDLKELAGLDATPAPMVLTKRSDPPARSFERAKVPSVSPTAAPNDEKRRVIGARRLGLIVVGLLIAGLIGHYASSWLGSSPTTHGDSLEAGDEAKAGT
jgi:hypothetical protein